MAATQCISACGHGQDILLECYTQMTSTVTRSQSNRQSTFRMRDLHHGCAANKSAATARCYHINTEECFQHLAESMPQKMKAVLKAKGVKSGTRKVDLIKCPVSAYSFLLQQMISEMICQKGWLSSSEVKLNIKPLHIYLRLRGLQFLQPSYQHI